MKIYIVIWFMMSFFVMENVTTAYQDDTSCHQLNINEPTLAVEWSPNGKMIAVANYCDIWIFTNDFEVIAHLNAHETVHTIVWSPDSSMLASAAAIIPRPSGKIRIWDVETAQTVTVIDQGLNTPIIWHPENNWVAGGTVSGSIHVWDAITGKEIQYFQWEPIDFDHTGSPTTAVCWGQGGETLIGIFNYNTYIIKIGTGEVVYQDEQHYIQGGGCNVSGTVLMDGYGEILNLETGEIIKVGDSALSIDGIAISGHPDDRTLAVNCENQKVQIWDAITGELITSLEGGMGDRHVALVYYHDSLAWHPDGTQLAVSSEDGIIRIWDTETWELITVFDEFAVANDMEEDE
jgi:WD40 repeat protein